MPLSIAAKYINNPINAWLFPSDEQNYLHQPSCKDALKKTYKIMLKVNNKGLPLPQLNPQ